MKIYLDLVLILNFLLDLMILITISIVLKRNVRSYRLILGALFGSITTIFLFFNLTSFELFIYKIIISFFMIIISFNYKNIKYTIKNIAYLYLVSILFGGFLYFLNISLTYQNNNFVFYKNNYSINFIFILLVSPIILIIYTKQVKELKNSFNNYYKIDIYVNNHILKVNAYLDTGNKLIDPIFKKPVLILNKRKMIYDINEFKMVLVPYKTITNNGILNCYIIPKINIKGVGIRKNVLVGLIDNSIDINGVDMILNTKILEDIC